MQDRTLGSATHPSDVVNKVHRPDFFSEALRRARTATVVRPARRTLAEMAPGHARPALLQLAPNVQLLPTAVWDGGDGDDGDVCPLCMRWSCICGQGLTAPAGTRAAVKAVA